MYTLATGIYTRCSGMCELWNTAKFMTTHIQIHLSNTSLSLSHYGRPLMQSYSKDCFTPVNLQKQITWELLSYSYSLYQVVMSDYLFYQFLQIVHDYVDHFLQLIPLWGKMLLTGNTFFWCSKIGNRNQFSEIA